MIMASRAHRAPYSSANLNFGTNMLQSAFMHFLLSLHLYSVLAPNDLEHTLKVTKKLYKFLLMSPNNYVRVQGRKLEQKNWGSPLFPPFPLPFPFPFPSSPLPSSRFLSLPSFLLSRSLPPLPLEVGLTLRLGGLGSAQAPPSGSGRSAAAKRFLVQFRLFNGPIVTIL